MRSFAALYAALDATTRTREKTALLASYFRSAAPADAVWTLALLSGRRLRRPVSTTLLRKWAAQAARIPDWLLDECYDAVGDLGETLALLTEPPTPPTAEPPPLHHWMEHVIAPLRDLPEDQQQAVVTHAWAQLSRPERFLFNKLIGGSFRVGVSQQLVVKGLAQASGLPEALLTHRLMGDWQPTPHFFASLLAPDDQTVDISRPYPFFLAYALDIPLADLGTPDQWQAEYKWDGIRAQLIRRQGQHFLWSRGEELITQSFPEMAALAAHLPDGTVLDGELLPWKPAPAPDPEGFPAGWGSGPASFADLQRRLGRKALGPKLLAEVPVRLVAYDLLEWQGQDLREQPFQHRRQLLLHLCGQLPPAAPILPSPAVAAPDWQGLTQQQQAARDVLAEGLMLKRLDSPYGTGRRRGDWWKWKVEPFTLDAVLVYAQRGTGRRASLYTDYTFAVWGTGDDGQPTLVPFAKAYSGLTDDEIRQVDAWIRRNTREKFGPVRTVVPELVFELAFEGIQLSARHKSGIAVRFPRILRWRTDKPATEADSLDTLRALLAAQ